MVIAIWCPKNPNHGVNWRKGGQGGQPLEMTETGLHGGGEPHRRLSMSISSFWLLQFYHYPYSILHHPKLVLAWRPEVNLFTHLQNNKRKQNHWNLPSWSQHENLFIQPSIGRATAAVAAVILLADIPVLLTHILIFKQLEYANCEEEIKLVLSNRQMVKFLLTINSCLYFKTVLQCYEMHYTISLTMKLVFYFVILFLFLT